ncbi:hypothetical protein VF21_10141 [Pseudogymnoascus sp. 05NY08]|nr:hypothetical protein VF21_10141 [Pseudogymnoascus sp. 05NY08]
MARAATNGGSIVHGPSQPCAIDKTFGNLLREQAQTNGNGLLVLSDHQNKSLTYSQADRRTDDLARGLAAMGVKKGDRVAVMMGNLVEYVELFFACAKLGALITLANYGYSERELHSVLSSCGTSVLVMVPGFDRYDYRPWILRLKSGIKSLEHVIMVNGEADHGTHSIPFEEVVLQGTKSNLDLLAIEWTNNSDDILNLQFTSGSTGNPKASALTHRGVFNAGKLIGDTMYLKSYDRICTPVPLFHSFGVIIGLATAAARGASIILPSEVFNIEATLQSVGKNKCTGIYGVTTMFVSEMAHPNFSQYDMTTLRFAIVAGSAVPESLIRRIWAAFGITQTHTNWGLTESSSICTMKKDTDTMEKRTKTSGRLFPGFSAKIVDPVTNLIMQRGEKGEILLRGAGVQKCYYGDEDKTKEAHKISSEDGLEWFHSGDEGYIDREGYFCITGRIKDMIIRGGENIAPLEIEERLTTHPAIAQVSVIGVPDEKYGEQIAAFVEWSGNGRVPTDVELRNWVRETLAQFKQPKYIWWLGSRKEFQVWPKTQSGKLRKPDLRIIGNRILASGVIPNRISARL